MQVTIQEDLLLGTLAKLKGIQGASIIEQRYDERMMKGVKAPQVYFATDYVQMRHILF